MDRLERKRACHLSRTRKIKLADPLTFDHEADAENYAFVHDLPGGNILLTPAELAKRWRTTMDALRKLRARNRAAVRLPEPTPHPLPAARRRQFRSEPRRLLGPAGAFDRASVRR